MSLVFTKQVLPRSLRYIHTSLVLSGEVNKQQLSSLRKTTGFPFVNCRKALEKFDNDVKQAEKWLREEAQKEGWSKATKLQGRPMSQGLIGLSVSENFASMVEVNCETDFVARNVKFQNLVAAVVEALNEHGKSNNISKAMLDHTQLGNLKFQGKQISDLAALEIGNLGENIAVRRGIVLKPDENQTISFYVHTVGPKLQQTSENCIMGKYGALVVCKEDPSIASPPPTEEEEGSQEKILSFDELGKQLCQHVVGMNPKSIGSFDDQQIQKSEDESRLLHQEFMFDASSSVKDVLRQHGVNIVEFTRMECGEELVAQSEEEPDKILDNSQG